MVLRLVNQSSCQGCGVSRLLTWKPNLTVCPWPWNPAESISKLLILFLFPSRIYFHWMLVLRSSFSTSVQRRGNIASFRLLSFQRPDFKVGLWLASGTWILGGFTLTGKCSLHLNCLCKQYSLCFTSAFVLWIQHFGCVRQCLWDKPMVKTLGTELPW